MNKKTAERIVTLIALLGVLALFAYFLKDIMIPLFKMELNNDVEGAKALLSAKGIYGGIAVALIEALQMVVIFIPAEFIQVTSGLSYPFIIALLLCDAGVCIGATIIYLLVRVFRFEAAKSREDAKRIEQIAADRKENNVSMLMYLLFITPVIPFGAICYFASSRDIRYRRYILTVATGVIPSIVTSNLIGAGVRSFIMSSIPLWVLLLIILFMMGVLFFMLWFVLDKVFFKGKDKTPDSAMYFIIKTFVPLWRKRYQRLHIDGEKLEGLKSPFVLLVNHVSFYDFFYVEELLKAYNAAYVINHHIFMKPVIHTIFVKCGMIPKRILCTDAAALKIMRTVKAGFSVIVFPEGRLSPDGRGSAIVEDAAALYRRMGVPLVLANISGAYFTNPKWRKKFFKGDVYITARRVITPEELKTMSVEEISETIDRTIHESREDIVVNYPQKDRAKGLETILYRCADCGKLYTTASDGCDLICTACGAVHHLDEHYRFTDELCDIPGYYDKIKAMEKDALSDSINLEAEVETVIFADEKPKKRKEKGVCTLNRDAFTYRSENIQFEIPTEKIPALAFSGGEEFELYHGNELYYFYPLTDRNQCAQWSLIIDLLREERETIEKPENAD